MINCQFTVAIHVLCLLTAMRGQSITSEFIAGSVNTNPVVIRRVLAVLREAGLVESQPGNSGGWVLIKKPSTITLKQVYQLIRPGTVFAMHNKEPNQLCPIGKNIQQGLSVHYQKAQEALEAELGKTTIADVLDDVLANER